MQGLLSVFFKNYFTFICKITEYLPLNLACSFIPVYGDLLFEKLWTYDRNTLWIMDCMASHTYACSF